LKLSPDFLPLKAAPNGLGALAKARHPLSLRERGFKTQYFGLSKYRQSSLLSMLGEATMPEGAFYGQERVGDESSTMVARVLFYQQRFEF
jgi:hypothetical protein